MSPLFLRRALAVIESALAPLSQWGPRGWRRHLDASLHAQKGQGLMMVIVLAGVGSLLLLPMMTLVRASYGSIDRDTDRIFAHYAADAGIEAVLADLKAGTDALDPSYVAPSVTLNGYTATISISEPTYEDGLPISAVYVDPGSSTDLNPLGEGDSFQYNLSNARAGTSIQINWAFTPVDADWELEVYEGTGTHGAKVLDEDGGSSPASHTVQGAGVVGGSYTIRFKNEDSVDMTSAEFSSTGDLAKTWLLVTAAKSYAVTSSAGNVNLTAFVQQYPGATESESSVVVVGWLGPQ